MAKYVCQYCGQAKGKNQRGLDMHESACPENPANKKGGKPVARTKAGCPDCGGTNYRFLNKAIALQAKHISEGCKYYCEDCQEVW